MIAGVWLFEHGQVEVAARHDDHPIPRDREPGAEDLDALTSRGELSRLLSRARSRGHGRGSFLWVDVLDPTPAELARLADVFRLAPLQVEDCLNPRQRPKIERGRTTFVVVRSVSYLDATSDIETHQVSAFVGPGFLVTVSHGQYDIADAMQARLAREPALRRLGTAAAFYALLDTVVDQYLAVSEEIAIDIEQIEESVFSPERTNDAERIYRLKRENLEVRRAVAPLASAARSLMRLEVPEIDGSLRPYYSDVADHLLRAAELAEGHDQLLMTMLMASTARQDLQQNMDMRRISAWVAIAAIPTLLAGIYGMNFDFMPELHWRLGYPLVMAVMVVSGLLLYRAFRRAKWL